jgi:signal transduction histidine kinase
MNEIVMVDLCHPDHLEGTYKAMAESAPHTNLVLHGPSGIYRWLSWRPIKSRSSGFFYAAGRDVTTEIEGKSNAESFVRLLCHEIRNPLVGIMGVTDVLLEQRPHLQTMLSFFEECLAVQHQQQQGATKKDNEVDATVSNGTNAALIQQAKHQIEQRIESIDLLCTIE